MPVSKQTLKAKVRTKASQVLFPLLETLNVRAALIGSAGLALIYPGHRATQELVVAVDHDDPTLRFPKLVSMIRAKDPSHFSSPSMKKETMTFQAKEVPEIGTKPCTIQFMFVKGMFGFSIDLTRSIVVQTFPVMPVPWVFLVLLEQWAKGGKKSRGAGKKITKDIIRALKVICAGCQDWAEFDIALAFFPCAKDRLSMLEAVDHVGTRTQMESIRRNTSISSLGLSGDIPRGSTPSATLHKIPETQSLLPQQPPALSSVPCIPPPSAGAPRVVNEVEGLPVVPVLVLLLHKLQGWEDYLKCPEMHKFRQHMVDVEDIKHLLGSVGEMPVKMFRPWSERELLGEGFVDASKARVKRFCVTFPETAVHWKGLGFELA
ncbi:hypothetical protein FA15DRAFT_658624 [Coprinopsis marcescibilis]|uniref:Uncharacterized protein n=1 Tax=Coprinopsis marcescibilis TaxID=230819 RepID=A0A5C3KL82_COPMA|nr:hypothetical protein FA15DRAFT_658624 [Coprinopsis marcescibilis]